MILKKGLLITGILLFAVFTNAQDRKLTKQERKEVRKTQMAANYSILGKILSSKKFVIEAYYLSNQYGDKINVSPTVNFISVNTSSGVLQTGVLNSLGYNGLGGVTAEGNLGKWEVQENPKTFSYFVRFSLMTNIGTYDISMDVNPDSRARAVISGLTPGKLIYEGYLVPPENSKVFKGTATY